MLPRVAVLLAMTSVLTRANLDNISHLTEVSAVEGQTAELPCDVSTPMAGDELRLVLWYYGTGGTPVYSYDSRDKNIAFGEHWVDNEKLDTRRVHFHPDSQPASLRITRVQQSDQRLYRCRVDFLHSPTRNSRVNLTVIVPPGPPLLFDTSGHIIERDAPHRYREGQIIQISCHSNGGSPRPNVTWWRGSSLLDDEWELAPDGSVRNHLTLGPLTRDDLGSRYTCVASNHRDSTPRATTTTIDMLLKPLSVQLLGSSNPLSAGVTYQLVCQSVGSRPSAVVTWWMEGQRLPYTEESTSHDGNVTTSRVTLTPRVEDNNQLLRCRSSNPLLSDVLEDVWRLRVRYAPLVRLKIWPSTRQRGTREGDDVHLKCIVKADPPVIRIVWKLNGVALLSDPRRDMVLSNDSLMLYRVSQDSSGAYTCAAFNDEGTTESEPVELQVQYVPRCESGQVTSYLVSRGETVQVTCRVSADPPPFRFYWAFNASGHLIDVPESNAESEGRVSVCQYTPRTKLDYGQLLCWAENDLGRQTRPCVFHVTPAERPDVPVNCTVINSSSEAFQVFCTPGHDGGLPQIFVLEVRDTQTQVLVSNATSDTPRFEVRGLTAGRSYRLLVYASNKKGSSVKHISQVQMPEDVAQRITAVDADTAPPAAAFQMTPMLGVLIGLVAVLILVAIFVVIGIRKCGRRRRGKKKDSPGVTEIEGVEVTEQSALDMKEKHNPDIVPTEFMDADEKYMLERLSNPTPRTLRQVRQPHQPICHQQKLGYASGSSGCPSPCSTLGSLKRAPPGHIRPPPHDTLPLGDMPYGGPVPPPLCASLRRTAPGGLTGAPGAKHVDEIAPFLPHHGGPEQNKESSV